MTPSTHFYVRSGENCGDGATVPADSVFSSSIQKTSRPYVPRENFGGNFCGHDPLKPCFGLVKKPSDKMPGILKKLMERLEEYYDNPDKIPSLNAANGSDRNMRSERREACITVLHCLLKYLDLATMRVEIPADICGKWSGFRVRTMADHCGIGEKRVSRALADLTAAGLIDGYQPKEETNDGGYKSLPSVRFFAKEIFGLFGLDKLFAKAKEKAIALRQMRRRNAEKRTEKQRRTAMSSNAKARESLNAAAEKRKADKAAMNSPSTCPATRQDKDDAFLAMLTETRREIEERMAAKRAVNPVS